MLSYNINDIVSSTIGIFSSFFLLSSMRDGFSNDKDEKSDTFSTGLFAEIISNLDLVFTFLNYSG